MMHTEIYCDNIDNMDKVKAIRAIHQAFLQLKAIGEKVEVGGLVYDNSQTISDLADALRDVKHAGFV